MSGGKNSRCSSSSVARPRTFSGLRGWCCCPRRTPTFASDLKKIKEGKKLSPILMVRGDLGRGIPAMVADGYHRVCASYYADVNIDIPLNWLTRRGNYRKPAAIPVEGGKCRSFSFR